MLDFEKSFLWKKTLGNKNKDKDKKSRELLRNAFFRAREISSILAGEISKNLPEHTIHDQTHFDALWEIADLIIGKKITFTPTEAFILGCSFLIHDLGLGFAAFSEGKKCLKNETMYNDTLISLFVKNNGREPSKEEMENPPKNFEKEALENTLRLLHAKNAEKLATFGWDLNGIKYYIIENNDLREAYGPLIGKIAHSHWWDIEQVQNEFSTTMGAPAWYPDKWVVDPLKIACILRIVDACHIDSRRAPGYLRALRQPSGISKYHWEFQQHINKPYIIHESLVYTSGHHFLINEAESWWLCYDTLQMIDKEIRDVNRVFENNSKPFLAVHQVSGVGDPKRLLKYIPTENWEPVDTRIRVNSIENLIEKFGGEELYGKNPKIPLRELIQNSSDAIRARRIMENQDKNWGNIIIRTGVEEGKIWIEVEDNGIGMSRNVLTGPLIDFATSFWSSPLINIELPGLLSKGFGATGKYGIGFFSIFIWGNHIKITTRRWETAQSDTLILEFFDGLKSRPILRKANFNEYLSDGGTKVRVWIEKIDSRELGIILKNQKITQNLFKDLIIRLCPSIDANILFEEDNKLIKMISSNDWIDIEGSELLKRIWAPQVFIGNSKLQQKIKKIGSNLRLLYDSKGNIVGRACIISAGTWQKNPYSEWHDGVITIGGLSSTPIDCIAGILLGRSIKVSRDLAIPVVDENELIKWSSEQAKLISSYNNSTEEELCCADTIRQCQGDIGNLKIAYCYKGWITYNELTQWKEIGDEIFLAPFEHCSGYYDTKGFKLNKNVLGIFWGGRVIVRHYDYVPWPQKEESFGNSRFSRHSAEGAVVEALAKNWAVELKDVVKCSLFPEEDIYERIIGTENNYKKTTSVMVIRNPKKFKIEQS